MARNALHFAQAAALLQKRDNALLLFDGERVARYRHVHQSPGGSVTAGLAMYDTMQYIKPQIATICAGMAASAASVLLAGGEKGSGCPCRSARS